MTHISVVSPIYGCANTLPILHKQIVETLENVTPNFEIILVDDRANDKPWSIITSLAKQDTRVKGIRLSRNFGQHHAITAGLENASGEYIVVMDCDLQDQPKEILKLYRKIKEGHDVVVGVREDRKDSFFKKASSKLFYKLYYALTGVKVDHNIGNFGIYSRKVIKAVSRFSEQSRSFGLFVLWTGFDRVEIEIEHQERPQGKSAYTFAKLLELALGSIISHSNRPLKLSVAIGFILSTSSLLYSFWLIIRYFIWANTIEGWTSLIVSLYFLSGLIIGSIGMVGLYVGRIFDEVKSRPLYIIQETTFHEDG